MLPPHLVKPVAIAFGVGLVLFLLLWLDQRSDNDFFKAGKPVTGQGEDEGTLPAPVPADVATDAGNASGLQIPRDETRPTVPDVEQPRLIEPPVPPPAPPASAPAPVASGTSAPVPLSRPAPTYPRDALRRNIGGTVRVEVTVATDGSVERLDLVEGSGNRDLDRAALEAVRRWTFRPATRDGQAVSANVVVPLEFSPGR